MHPNDDYGRLPRHVSIGPSGDISLSLALTPDRKPYHGGPKKRLAGDTAREASSDEVKALRAEARDLKEALAEQILENRLLKKSVLGDGGDDT